MEISRGHLYFIEVQEQADALVLEFLERRGAPAPPRREQRLA